MATTTARESSCRHVWRVGQKLTVGAIKSITRGTLVANQSGGGIPSVDKVRRKRRDRSREGRALGRAVIRATFEAVSTNAVGNIARDARRETRASSRWSLSLFTMRAGVWVKQRSGTELNLKYHWVIRNI